MDLIGTLLGYIVGTIVAILLCLYIFSLLLDYLRRYAVIIIIFLVMGLVGTLYEVFAGDREEVKEDEYVESNETYILPNSNTDLLTHEDVENLSDEELRLARNEIFARHGYIFEDEGLQQYFNRQSWYFPNENFYSGMLSNTEKQNIELIKIHEQ